MDVIFDLGESRLESGAREPGYIVGAMLEALVVGMTGRVDLVGVRFEPGAAGTWLGLPATELTARSIGLGEVRREADLLTERLDESGRDTDVDDTVAGWHVGAARKARTRLRNRSAVLDRALVSVYGGGPDPLVAGAVRLIEASGGAIGVAELQRRLAVSPRTLTRRFSAAVGLTPKTACRVARLQMAAALVRSEPGASLARLAVRAGFHDQAHMTRDFAELACITPAGFAREARDGFVQDASLPGA